MHQFFDPLALAIVLGGTVLAAVLRAPLADVTRALVALGTLGRARFAAAPLLTQVSVLGRLARRHGALSLDRSVVRDPDIAAAVAAIVDGAQPREVEQLLGDARRARTERHHAAAEVWSTAAETAPAMGMIGTLIGLARMFATIDDPAAIGGAMAVALLATLYGAVFANLLLAPVAARLRAAARVELIERARLVPALAALAEQERPRVTQARAA
jgi:chemotaxis protein MotA